MTPAELVDDLERQLAQVVNHRSRIEAAKKCLRTPALIKAAETEIGTLTRMIERFQRQIAAIATEYPETAPRTEVVCKH